MRLLIVLLKQFLPAWPLRLCTLSGFGRYTSPSQGLTLHRHAWSCSVAFSNYWYFQPAVTTQTFGHKYGGFIYAFLFSSDIVNNLMVATMSKVCFKFFISYLSQSLSCSGNQGKFWLAWSVLDSLCMGICGSPGHLVLSIQTKVRYTLYLSWPLGSIHTNQGKIYFVPLLATWFYPYKPR